MNNKRYQKYLKKRIFVLCLLLVVACFSFGYSYSNFIYESNDHRAVEMYINKLSYDFKINDLETSTYSLTSGINILNIDLKSNNEVETYYKLSYPSNNYLKIYNVGNSNSYGSIAPNETKNITLLVVNNSEESVVSNFIVNSGYITNTLDDVKISSEDTEIISSINVGDYISYIPNGVVGVTKYNATSDLSGYTSTQDVYLQNTLWRILNINSDGTIDLISDKELYINSDKSPLYLSDSIGYNNGVYLLNDICNQLYASSAYVIDGRNLNIEDIDKYLVSKNTSQKEFITYTKNTYYPTKWESELNSVINGLSNGILLRSDDGNIISNNVLTSSNISMKSNLNPISLTENGFINNVYYTIFVTSGNYWLSSRYVDTLENYGTFGILKINNNSLNGSLLYDSSNNIYTDFNALRPVITLSRNINLSFNDSANIWEINN